MLNVIGAAAIRNIVSRDRTLCQAFIDRGAEDILNDALETVQVTINPQQIKKIQSEEIEEEEKPDEDGRTIIILNENDEIRHEDEVFEAFIKREISADEAKEEEKGIDEREMKNDKKQSRRVLSELKTVLACSFASELATASTPFRANKVHNKKVLSFNMMLQGLSIKFH